MAKTTKLTIPARIVIVAPPKGVVFALQRGKNELASSVTSAAADLALSFTIQVDRDKNGALRCSGEFVQGPAGGKFVYLNSGTLAGQAESPWTRRAKIALRHLSWALIERVSSTANTVLQARVTGTAKDGGPACATVALLDGNWTAELRT
jgi:hypothetical protein